MNALNLLKSNLILSFITLLGMLFNFISQLVIASLFGTTIERDAYFVAMAFPAYLSAVLLGAYGVVFLPAFIQKQKDGYKKSKVFVSNNINIIFIIVTVVTIGGIIYAKEILSFTAAGLNGEELDLATQIFKFLLPVVIFQSLINILSSVSQSQNNFVLPAISPIVTSIVSLVFLIILFPYYGILSLAIGTLVGNFLSLLLFMPVLTKNYTFHINFYDKDFHRVVIISLPLLLSGLITRSNSLFERFVASTLPQGSISYLGYATQIQNILCSVAISSIGTIIFPLLAKKWAENDLDLTRKYYSNGIRLILIITVPIAILFVFEGEVVIQMIFERGNFLHESTIIVSRVFSLLALSFICTSLASVVSKIFYLTGKTVVVSLTEVFVSLVYFLISLLLVKDFSFYGLAAASSLTTFMSILIILYLGNKLLKGIDFVYILKGPAIVLIFSIASITIIDYLLLPHIVGLNIYLLNFLLISSYCFLLYLMLVLIKFKELVTLNLFILKFFDNR
ncbi:murein biosynthesis integral membrane protein MurJ [Adhaeribacter rhizoryzae]|uniref:murein biosynthesis integral membrane protein MurJ n=1 Tax=Adhaeribacter rhizoryzae TaxID=2607907 RepID=UPI00167FE227|nr:murein biosynthesis integral membrane protein MurJ [Adhaeribacter rhizoryzae]